ncbi:MAG TPA: peptidoglycan editing factor PgeF [Burkholderiales bacterium]|jgi:YfiH family protein
MRPQADWIVPDWPAPPRVRALMTTRNGGVSQAPFDSMNLGSRVGDDTGHVQENRARLRTLLPAEPHWLRQVHGARAIEARGAAAEEEADACVARAPGEVCAVLVADCLPVLFCDRAGSVVAVAHAGWRGLSGGILESTVAAMRAAPADLLAWLGPAIGPDAFEVGRDVLDAFTASDSGAAAGFRSKPPACNGGPPVSDGEPSGPGGEPKWFADLYALARRRLAAAGVHAVSGGGLCTRSDARRFFSHRRDRRTGRQAALIWLEA